MVALMGMAVHLVHVNFTSQHFCYVYFVTTVSQWNKGVVVFFQFSHSGDGRQFYYYATYISCCNRRKMVKICVHLSNLPSLK